MLPKDNLQVLIVHGTEDRLVNVEHSMILAKVKLHFRIFGTKDISGGLKHIPWIV